MPKKSKLAEEREKRSKMVVPPVHFSKPKGESAFTGEGRRVANHGFSLRETEDKGIAKVFRRFKRK